MAPKRDVIFVATKNADKFRELVALWGDEPGLPRLVAAPPDFEDVAETETTYEGNALLKARALSSRTGEPALADDSGIEVEALGGAPGVLSARTPRPGASAAERNEWILAELAARGDVSRRARMVCACALVTPGNADIVTLADVEGEIADSSAGGGGFGYDSIFMYPAYGVRFAEVSGEEKNMLSHRGKALRALRARLLVADRGDGDKMDDMEGGSTRVGR